MNKSTKRYEDRGLERTPQITPKETPRVTPQYVGHLSGGEINQLAIHGDHEDQNPRPRR
jgi:hypothetical protein